jgi:beta-aspartyl-peptidase (threonine type)
MLSKPPITHSYLPSTRRGCSATLLTCTKNPSKLVEALYTRPDIAPHALLSGFTAEVELGHERLGTELIDPSYFYTEQRWKEHRRGLGLPEKPSDSSSLCPSSPAETLADADFSAPFDLMPKGTVGAVALDSYGCIAVVTSTGGKTNKLVGRIGDTPSMGSGFWAEEWVTTKKTGRLARFMGRVFGLRTGKLHVQGVGVSGTGDGDVSPAKCSYQVEIDRLLQYFIRQATCAMLGARMKIKGDSVTAAADDVVANLERDGGIGGVIALDRDGNGKCFITEKDCRSCYF